HYAPDHRLTLRAIANLAKNYRDLGRLAEAIELYEEVLETLRKNRARFLSQLPGAPFDLAVTYCMAGQFAKAEPIFRDILEEARKRFSAEHVEISKYLGPLGLSLLKQDKCAEAESLLRECLDLRMKKLPDDWTTFNTRSMLGGALLAQKQYRE